MNYEPINFKKKIYSILKDITIKDIDLKKYHKSSNSIKQLPCITYFITNENVNYCFKGVMNETAIFQLDIYSENKSEITKIVNEVKKVMFANNVKYIRGLEFEEESNIGRYILQFEID